MDNAFRSWLSAERIDPWTVDVAAFLEGFHRRTRAWPEFHSGDLAFWPREKFVRSNPRAPWVGTGERWLCISLDFVRHRTIVETLRLDLESDHVRGGWSPCGLNGDDGVLALDAGVDVGPPDGIDLIGPPSDALAELAAAWFDRHRRAFAAGAH